MGVEKSSITSATFIFFVFYVVTVKQAAYFILYITSPGKAEGLE